MSSFNDEYAQLEGHNNGTKEHLDNDCFDVECDHDFKMALDKLNDYKREEQQWLEHGILTLDDIVDLLMRGVFEMTSYMYQGLGTYF